MPTAIRRATLRVNSHASREGPHFCSHRDVRFNLDSHVVAVAKKMVSHRLNRFCWIPHGSCHCSISP
jgi:hypothetical protein